jgi:hypothetical protein
MFEIKKKKKKVDIQVTGIILSRIGGVLVMTKRISSSSH